MRVALFAFGLSILALAPGAANAQSDAGTTTPAAGPAPALSEGELDQLVAPVALYPDPLLANVLMAATYPIEVVEADRWADANKSLTDLQRTEDVDQQSWHAAVKALVDTASVLDMMSNQLTWTQKLGNAVLADQASVMAAVQRLRAQAEAQKKLQTTSQQTVTVQTQNADQVILIQPAVAGTVYVPYYDPTVVYGPWRWPAWPPFYFPPPTGFVVAGLNAGIVFGVGYPYNWVVYGGFDWWNRDINIHWNIHVNGNDTVHVESWHHGVNDRSEDFAMTSRHDGGGDGGDKNNMVPPPPDPNAARADDTATHDDGTGDGEGNMRRDEDGLGDGMGGDSMRRGDGFGGGGGDFSWRRPVFREGRR